MAKLGELNWDEDLTKSEKEYKHTPTALWAADMYGSGKEGVDPLNKAEKRLKEGEVPYRPTDKEISDAIMYGASSQPTDEEMFGGGVVTEEMVQKAQAEWDNRMNKSLTHVNIGEEDDGEWANGESFNKSLSPEELAKRNMHVEK